MNKSQKQLRDLDGIHINTPKELARRLGIELGTLLEIAGDITKHHYKKPDLDKKGKERVFYPPKVTLRKVQSAIQKTLLDRLKYPPHFHGGIKRHSVATNAQPHTKKLLVAKFDIKSFYPNTSHKCVYKAFRKQGCAPQVARILTQLTTTDGHLAQGFLTSPKVSCLVLWDINRRLTALFQKHKLDHTIWIDDLTVSGSYPIQKLEPIITKIFQSEGFEIKPSTESTYTYRDERQNVTGVGVNSEVVAPKKKIARLSAIKHAITRYGTSAFIKKIGTKDEMSQLKQSIQGDISFLIAINRVKYSKYYNWFKTESKKDAWG